MTVPVWGQPYARVNRRPAARAIKSWLVRFTSGIAGFAGATGGFLAAVRIDPLGDRIPMDAQGSGSVRNPLLVPTVRLLNVKLLEFFQGFIEHNMTVKHVIDYCFQAGAYLHRIPSTVLFRFSLQAFADKQLVCFQIARGGCRGHFRGQSWRRRLLVPVNTFEIIAHILLVERRLGFTHLVTFERPETR